jgi:hypothetical protein
MILDLIQVEAQTIILMNQVATLLPPAIMELLKLQQPVTQVTLHQTQPTTAAIQLD